MITPDHYPPSQPAGSLAGSALFWPGPDLRPVACNTVADLSSHYSKPRCSRAMKDPSVRPLQFAIRTVRVCPNPPFRFWLKWPTGHRTELPCGCTLPPIEATSHFILITSLDSCSEIRKRCWAGSALYSFWDHSWPGRGFRLITVSV